MYKFLICTWRNVIDQTYIAYSNITTKPTQLIVYVLIKRDNSKIPVCWCGHIYTTAIISNRFQNPRLKSRSAGIVSVGSHEWILHLFYFLSLCQPEYWKGSKLPAFVWRTRLSWLVQSLIIVCVGLWITIQLNCGGTRHSQQIIESGILRTQQKQDRILFSFELLGC